MTYSKGTSAPSATTMNLTEVGKLTEGSLVSQRDIEEAMVSEGAHGSESSRLLATTLGASRDEKTGILSPEATSGPDATGLVPESLPLGREVTVASGDPEENGIVLEELSGFGDRVGGLGRSMHLLQDLIREGLGNLVHIGLATGSFNALLLGLGQLLDVAVHGVLEIGQLPKFAKNKSRRSKKRTKTIAILGAMVKIGQLT